jgi:hypothetical protein
MLTPLTGGRCSVAEGTVTIFYGSGSKFYQVMVLVPTFDKFWFRFRLHIETIKSTVQPVQYSTVQPFYIASFFTRKKLIKFILKNANENC